MELWRVTQISALDPSLGPKPSHIPLAPQLLKTLVADSLQQNPSPEIALG